MALHTIKCENCGSPRLTRRKNTKYCRLCRILKNLEYLDTWEETCIACENRFAPLQRGEDLCGDCAIFPAQGDPKGPCAICHEQDARLMEANINVCQACSTKPENRKILIQSLKKKIVKIMKGDIEVQVDTPEEVAEKSKRARRAEFGYGEGGNEKREATQSVLIAL